MKDRTDVSLNSPCLSLKDLLGEEYIRGVCEARCFLDGRDVRELLPLAEERVELYPASFRRRVDELLDFVGKQVCRGVPETEHGGGTAAFDRASNSRMAPVSGLGYIRIGEDGKAYLISKSEHYHASLGHGFPGFRLLDNARRLGIDSATHNNTRGYITRRLERELVRIANGIEDNRQEEVDRLISAGGPRALSRVLNLQTGSLAVEAALKMVLSRFYRFDRSSGEPVYHGRAPVVLVMADEEGGCQANYHGTSILCQAQRGLWPDLVGGLEESRFLRIRPVRINDIGHFERVLKEYDSGDQKVAGFFHEIVLMNYGGIRLTRDYLLKAYDLCRERDVPVVADEVQTGVWYPGLFLFKEYGLEPDVVVVGKGLSGGFSPASRVLSTAVLDNLSQFGALVTNGQDEASSLAYLVTMAFAQANREHTRSVGRYYQSRLEELAARYGETIDRIEGLGHLSSLFFHSVDRASRFVSGLNAACIDISAHTYKAKCPPAALTKLPLVSTFPMVDFLIGSMDAILKDL